MQHSLATRYCPQLVDQMFYANIGETKQNKILVRFTNDTTTANNEEEHHDVPLTEWIEMKKHIIEWTLDLYKDASCRGKMRDMEKELFACDDEMMLLSSV